MQALAASSRIMQSDEAFTLGLLSHIGELGLATLFPQAYGRLLTQAVPAVAALPGAAVVPIPAVPFSMLALALAATGSVVMLILLAVMRKAVGPMQPHKRKPDRR